MSTINPHTTRAAGTILTATIYNTDHVNHVLNATNLNNDKVEGATPPVVDREVVLFSGTGGAALQGTSGRLRIDTNGKVIVTAGGTTDGVNAVSGTSSALEVLGTNLAGSSIHLGTYRNDATGAAAYLTHSRNTTVGSHTILQSGDLIGQIIWAGSDGTDFEPAAQITASVDGTPGANDMPGRLGFWTTPDGSTTLAESMRIDQAGRVIIGDIGGALTALFSEVPSLQLQGTAGDAQIATMAFRADASGPAVEMVKSRSATVGTHTIVQNGDSLGSIAWGGSDGSVFREGARIQASVDGTPGANDMPTRLLFLTTPDGSGSPSESMRIDNAGEITSRRGGLGYGTGAGGAVTQITSKSTTVTLNALSGVITTHNAALGSSSSVVFFVSNNKMATGSCVIVNIGAGGTDASYRVEAVDCISAGFNIRLTNVSGGSLNDAVDINFAIVRTSTS